MGYVGDLIDNLVFGENGRSVITAVDGEAGVVIQEDRTALSVNVAIGIDSKFFKDRSFLIPLIRKNFQLTTLNMDRSAVELRFLTVEGNALHRHSRAIFNRNQRTAAVSRGIPAGDQRSACVAGTGSAEDVSVLRVLRRLAIERNRCGSKCQIAGVVAVNDLLLQRVVLQHLQHQVDWIFFGYGVSVLIDEASRLSSGKALLQRGINCREQSVG